MKKLCILLTALTLVAVCAWAKEKTNTGTVISETSVPCGSQKAKHHSTKDLLCQEYVIRTNSTEYHVRQAQQYHAELVPVNTQIEFKLDKDKMKFKVDGKQHELIVVSEAVVGSQP